MSERISGGGLLADYVIAVVGAYGYIGRRSGADPYVLEPAYEARVKYMMDGRSGNFAIIRECTPVFGSTVCREVNISKASLLIDCSRLSGREREAWSQAIQECEALIKAMRAAESGIVVAPGMPEPAPNADPADPLGLLRK